MNNAERTREFKLYRVVGTTHVWQLKGEPDKSPFFYETKLAIDVDGAPRAYGPLGTPGTLDYLGNANSNLDATGRTGRWTSIVTNRQNQPIQQGPEDPAPGFYISSTSLHDDYYNPSNPKRYVDATGIPFLALPPSYLGSTGLKLGDFAFVINGHNGRYTFAIFADTKNLPNLGEASGAVADNLGIPWDLRWRDRRRAGDRTAGPGGANNGIIYLVFPDSGIGQGSVPSAETIAHVGASCLDFFSRRIDKESKFTTCFSQEYPGIDNAFKRALNTA